MTNMSQDCLTLGIHLKYTQLYIVLCSDFCRTKNQVEDRQL